MKRRLLFCIFSLSLFWLGMNAAAEGDVAGGESMPAYGVNAFSGKWPAVSKLPKDIQGQAGKVSLVANFEAAKGEGGVPVYLINLSEGSLKLSVEDSDVYMMQETRDLSGAWVRSQTHRFSTCGNSYMDLPELQKGHFMEITGYQAAKGVQAPVRYKLYQGAQDLVTAEGIALVDPAEVKAVLRDEMTLAKADLPLLREVLLAVPEAKADTQAFDDPKPFALQRLMFGKFDRPEVEALLNEVESQFPNLQMGVDQARLALKNSAEREAKAKAEAEAKPPKEPTPAEPER